MMYKDLSDERTYAARQYEKEKEYWLGKLAGELRKSSFPPDINALGSKERRQAAAAFKLPPRLFERLAVIGNNSDSRLHMLLVTGLSLLLYKYTGLTDIIIGTPIDKQDIEGEFINTILALRNQIEEQRTVKEFLMQVKQTIVEAGEHQNYPLETAVYELNLPVTEGEFPLFDTAVLLRNIQDKRYIEHIDLNMIFSFLRTDEHLEGVVEYNASVFTESTVRRIIDYYIHLMETAFNNADLKLADILLVTEEEREKVVVDFNKTAADYPRDKTIRRLFEEQVEKTPGGIAVEAGEEILTYEELNRKANQLARVLREKGVGNDTTAAVMLDSSIDVPVALLAVLKAGGTYLPMGFEYPEERINYLVKDSGAVVLLTRGPLVSEINITCPVVYLEENTLYTGDGGNLGPVDNADGLAYIIYTSGTTGLPKGVMVKQRGLVNYISWAARTYAKNGKTDFPLYTSISFDLTVTSIFTPLVTGGTVVVYGGTDKQFYIEQVIEEGRVGVVKLTPSHMKMIRHKIIKDTHIRCLIVGGEELETGLARDIHGIFPGGVDIYNEYGPTETVVGSMIYKFNPETDRTFSVPIGGPVANTQVYLLDRNLNPVPVGVEGEIYISGDGLARGYFHNPRLTEEKFIPNPFIPGEKMYRTGDLGVRLPDGNLEYKGRSDHQVKIRGYRVETGEIETRIVEFQKMSSAKREQREDIVKKLDLKSVTRCTSCLIPANYPGIRFDEQGVCDVCNEYENYKHKAMKYFKTPADFKTVVEKAQRTKQGKYDCLMLYSGGKDSSYVLHRLVEMGLEVLAFTFDNGYISATAFENIRRTTALLGVDGIILDSEAMKEVFVESLWADYNVCNGCFKAVNTLGTKVAHDHDINLVVSGLTRGQIFDIKLNGLFKLDIFDEDAIDERLKLFRKNYHSMSHRSSRLIGETITDEMLDNIYFTDFFKYDGISTSEIFEYLKEKDGGWVRPTDTGASSSNCIINDVGIYVHLKDREFHFYSAQLSWDCRLGTITREEGLEEITGFEVDYPTAHRVLNEIGYYDAFTGAVVVDMVDGKGEKALCAYIVAEKDFEISELRAYLSMELPDYMIPAYFNRIDKIPLTPSGKIDRKALPDPEFSFEEEYTAPRNASEKRLTQVWAELLGLKEENIGIDTNFFEVGGHSLRATFLAAAVQKEFDVSVPLVKIFETPTIRGLAEYIGGAAEEIFVSIPPAEKKQYYALSSSQKRFYVMQQLEPDSTAYNSNVVLKMEGRPDREKMETVFNQLLQRHEALRTSFKMIDGEPVQKVHDHAGFDMEYYDLEGKGDRRVENKIKKFVRSFDLDAAPLFRAGLIRKREEEHLLMVDMHHIVSDGTSLNLLIKEFMMFYGGETPAGLSIQFKDFCQWQQNRLKSGELREQEVYWLKQFEGELPVLNMPLDFARPPIQSFDGDTIYFKMEKEQARRLKESARARGATLFMVLLAVYNILLSKYTGQEDIIVGSPTAGRNNADLENVVGLLMETIVFRAYPAADKSFAHFLREVKEITLGGFENQEYPFRELMKKVAEENVLDRNPLFDAMLVLQNMELTDIKIDDLTLSTYPGDLAGTSKVDFTLTAFEVEEGILFNVEYCTKLFKKETMERFARHFLNIARKVTDNPELPLAGIDMIGEGERRRLLEEFNGANVPHAADKTLSQLFEEQAARSGDGTALVGWSLRGGREDRISYRELNEESGRVARFLAEKGVRPDTVVGIEIEPSIEMMAGILGILKSGGAYLPIEPGYPEERKQYMMKDSGARVLLTPDTLAGFSNSSSPHTFSPSFPAGPGNLAYVMYTSGSTGRPKGVMVEHRSVTGYLFAFGREFGVTSADTVLQQASYCFDVFVEEVYPVLSSGGRLAIPRRNQVIDIDRLCDFIARNKVTVVDCSPLLLNELNKPGALPHLESVRLFISGGDVLKGEYIDNLLEIGDVYNTYGPTETTVCASYHKCTAGVKGPVPIGTPITNYTVHILGERGELLPIGVPGELCIAGAGIARGYLNNPTFTAERFNRSNKSYRSYKTGDFARWLPDGTLQFLGRIDNQVKIRGYRVEPGEIEARLLEQKNIKEAVVIERTAVEGGTYLCAYIAAEDLGSINSSGLKQFLSRTLPDYMVPSRFIAVGAIPYTSSGKLDLKALPEEDGNIETGTEYVAPRNEIEQKLADMWSAILNVETIGIYDDFFDLGGQSLLGMKFVSLVNHEFNVRLPLIDLFRERTVKGIAKSLAAAGADPGGPGGAGKDSGTGVERRGLVRPFDLSTAPLLRASLIKLGEQRHLFFIDTHHIVSDGISLDIVAEKFIRLYSGRHVPEPALQYKDFAEWQADFLESDEYRRREKYWLDCFKGEIPELELPLDFPRSEAGRGEAQTVSIDVDSKLARESRAFAVEREMTLFMLFLAVYNIVLAHSTGREDIVVGAPVSGRTHAHFERMIGMFVNTLPLRNFPGSRRTVSGFLTDVKERCLAALENQDYQFDMLVDKLGLSGGTKGNPLFNTMFTLHAMESKNGSDNGVGELKFTYLDPGTLNAQLDLALTTLVSADSDGIQLNLRYDSGLFKEETVRGMLEQVAECLSRVVRRRDTHIGDINITAPGESPGDDTALSPGDRGEEYWRDEVGDGLPVELSPEEREYLLYTLNDTEMPYPREKAIHRIFEDRVRKSPDRTAVVSGDLHLTYRRLDRQANRTAVLLLEAGVTNNPCIGIKTRRSVHMMAGILGILKAGGCYVPIGVDYPAKRTRYIVEDAGIKILLAETDDPGPGLEQTEVKVLALNDPRNRDVETVEIPAPDVQPDGPAYVIYTSGSTGLPKGVVVDHRAVVNRLTWMQGYYPHGEDDTVIQKTVFTFDVSVLELFGWFVNGSRLYLLESAHEKDPGKILRAVGRHRITSISFTPSMFHSFLGSLKESGDSRMVSLKWIFLAGEQLPVGLVKKYRSFSLPARLENLYGPTEAAVYAGYYSCGPGTPEDRIPIGKPLGNTRFYILDPAKEPTAVGKVGELYLAGDSLAQGYLNRPDQTDDNFLPDPFYPGEIMYRTGDFARYLPDGNVVFLGRMDHQVKIKGIRIELGEIEAALSEHPHVREAAVLDRDGFDGIKYLEAYITVEKDLTVKELRAHVKQKLPEYMVPNTFYKLEKMPLTSSAKLNRNALTGAGAVLIKTETEYIAPRNDLERKLALIWSGSLKRDRIGIRDNFFDMGGDSLRANLTAVRINETFNTDLSLNGIFDAPTIEELAGVISRSGETARPARRAVAPVRKKEYYRASSQQKRLFVLDGLNNNTAYNVSAAFILDGPLDEERFQGAFKKLVQKYEILRTCFHVVDGDIVQKVEENPGFEVELFEVDHNDVEKILKGDTPLRKIGRTPESPEHYSLSTIKLEKKERRVEAL